jgi:signal peptidase II
MAVTTVVVILDQITKEIIDRSLELSQYITIIPNFVDIHYIRNTGAAFGIMSRLPDGARLPFLVGVSIVAMALIFYLFVKAESDRKRYIFSLSLIFAGALGNLIDRIWLGEVRDFIDLHIYNLHWPIFNVADSAITIGIVLLGYELLIVEPRIHKKGTS